MKTIKLTVYLLACSYFALGQNYLNIGPYSGGNSHVGRISTSGQYAELSMMNRKVSSFVDSPSLGERWLFYVDGTTTDGKLRIWTGGDKVTFTKEGRVGIGTSSPSKLLDVNGDAKIGNISQRHYLKITSESYPEIRYQTPSGDETVRIGMASGVSSFYLLEDQDFYVWTAQTNSTPLLVKQNGNIALNAKMGRVGIGKTSPLGKLDISAGSDYPIRTSTSQRHVIEVKNSNDVNGGWWLANDANGDFALHENGVGDRVLVKERGGLEVNSLDNYAIRTATSNRSVIEVRNTNDAGGGWWLANDANGDFAIHENGVGDRLVLQDGGNVGIGTTTPDAKLTVKGDIHAERVKVDLNIPAPDYVFEADYDLRSLDETDQYIKANKHLPEVPSAEELEASGIDLVEMNMLLLKKIEELTLYVIELERKMNQKNYE